MNRSRSVSSCADIAADSPILIEDVIRVGWHTVDHLPDTHPLRAALIFAVWALEDAHDAGACTTVAASVVVCLVARVA